MTKALRHSFSNHFSSSTVRLLCDLKCISLFASAAVPHPTADTELGAAFVRAFVCDVSVSDATDRSESDAENCTERVYASSFTNYNHYSNANFIESMLFEAKKRLQLYSNLIQCKCARRPSQSHNNQFYDSLFRQLLAQWPWNAETKSGVRPHKKTENMDQRREQHIRPSRIRFRCQ